MNYYNLFEKLGLSAEFVALSQGQIHLPLINYDYLYWYGYPPALLPIFSKAEGPLYWGIWKHWFSERPISVVEMYVEFDRMIKEIGRTEDQLFAYLINESICTHEGITDDLRKFARVLKIDYLNYIDEQYPSDDLKDFGSLKPFDEKTPLECFTLADKYDGWFPTKYNMDKRFNWCSYDVPEEFMGNWPDEVAKPGWLEKNNSMQKLFEKYLSRDDLSSAWLCLNSKGWLFKDAIKAIKKLDEKANNQEFSELTNIWTSLASQTPEWGY